MWVKNGFVFTRFVIMPYRFTLFQKLYLRSLYLVVPFRICPIHLFSSLSRYSGAWSWQAIGPGPGSDPLKTQLRGIGTLKNKNNQSEGGRVAIDIRDRSFISWILQWIWIWFG